ncbi:MAG: hypothetical protein K2I62_00955, partial [Alistipes sp.]|nr:hypothetical protein [Alistipes sp.]
FHPCHRLASLMPWRSEQEQRPGGLIKTKIVCFIQIATLIAFARNDGADSLMLRTFDNGREKRVLGKAATFIQIATDLPALAMTDGFDAGHFAKTRDSSESRDGLFGLPRAKGPSQRRGGALGKNKNRREKPGGKA